jgi:hypothetical protein
MLAQNDYIMRRALWYIKTRVEWPPFGSQNNDRPLCNWYVQGG